MTLRENIPISQEYYLRPIPENIANPPPPPPPPTHTNVHKHSTRNHYPFQKLSIFSNLYTSETISTTREEITTSIYYNQLQRLLENPPPPSEIISTPTEKNSTTQHLPGNILTSTETILTCPEKSQFSSLNNSHSPPLKKDILSTNETIPRTRNNPNHSPPRSLPIMKKYQPFKKTIYIL